MTYRNFTILLIGFVWCASSLQGQTPAPNNGVATVEALLSLPDNLEKTKKLNDYAEQMLGQNAIANAEAAAQKALELAVEQNAQFAIAKAYFNLGLVATSRQDYRNSMTFFVEALKIYDATGDKGGAAMAKHRIGYIFAKQNDENSALKNYQAALQILAEGNNTNAQASVRRDLGDVYLAQKIYGKALSEYEQAMNLWGEAKDLRRAASTASYMGKVATEMGQNEQAETYFTASLNFHTELDDANGAGDDLMSLAALALPTDPAIAAEKAQMAQRAYESTQNSLGKAAALACMATAQLKTDAREEAAQNLEKAASILGGMPMQAGVPEIYQTLASAHKTLGNFEKAYQLSTIYAAAKDSVFNKEKATALLDVTTKYESEFSVKEKTRQLDDLKTQKANERKFLWLVIGLLILAAVTAVLAYQNYRTKKHDNERLKSLNGQIKEQNDVLRDKSEEIKIQNDLIERKNDELKSKNDNLDSLNQKLVSEMSEREQVQSASFSKDHFLANVTNQMRQPLNQLIDISQKLLNEKPRNDQQGQIQQLQFAGNEILVLLNDMLDFSNIEAGKLSLNNSDFHIAKVVESLNKSVQNNAVSYEIERDMPEMLNGDPTRLTQILTYFSKNLVEAANETVKVIVSPSEWIDSVLAVKIDFQAKAANAADFDAIVQFLTEKQSNDETTVGNMELMVAKRLVELQNGTLMLNTEADNAISLKIFLPFKAVEVEDVNEVETIAKGQAASLGAMQAILEGKRILVAEDNKINQTLVAAMLRRNGVKVTVANDGIEALEALENADFDLILMDLQMPRMDGYRAVSEIRKLETAKSQLPIIAFTASMYVNKMEKAQLFGMTDHIGKPFSQEELLEKVSRIIQLHHVGIIGEAVPQASNG